MALQLDVTDTRGNHHCVHLARSPFHIGRSRDNDLCLTASGCVSRHHARVSEQDSHYQLEILGKNPSFLNGTLLFAGSIHEIVDGDIIGLPEHALAVREVDDAPDPCQTTETFAATSAASLVAQMVASSIGMPSFSADAFQLWLAADSRREVRIFHDRMELKLAADLQPGDLTRRMQSFGTLVVDPKNVLIEVHDPSTKRHPLSDKRSG